MTDLAHDGNTGTAPDAGGSAQGPTREHLAGNDDLWAAVERIHSWLDSHRTHGPQETLLLRTLKLSEEVGEVAEAVIGAMGNNPRKGHSHSWADVEKELCDVVLTALVALRTLTPDAEAALSKRLSQIEARAADVPAQPTPEM